MDALYLENNRFNIYEAMKSLVLMMLKEDWSKLEVVFSYFNILIGDHII